MPTQVGYSYIDSAGVWTPWDSNAVRFCRIEGGLSCRLPEPPPDLAAVHFNVQLRGNGEWLCAGAATRGGLRIHGFDIRIVPNRDAGTSCEALPERAAEVPQQVEQPDAGEPVADPVAAEMPDAAVPDAAVDSAAGFLVQASLGRARLNYVGGMWGTADLRFPTWFDWTDACEVDNAGELTCIIDVPGDEYRFLDLNVQAGQVWACANDDQRNFEVTVVGGGFASAPVVVGNGQPQGCNLRFER